MGSRGKDMQGVLELVVRAKVARTALSTREVTRAIRGLLTPFLNSSALARFELAVAELCNNAVEHGDSEVPTFEVFVDLGADELRFRLRDTGTPFDPREFTCAEIDSQRIESLPTGSMGLGLVHDSMDAVSWSLDGDTQTTTLRLRVDRESTQAAPTPIDGR